MDTAAGVPQEFRRRMTDVEFSRKIAVDTLRASERAFVFEAEEGELRALAGRFGILAIERFHVRARVKLLSGALVRVNGDLAADVVQACVVTLVPVASHVEDCFTTTFATDRPADPREVVVDLDAEDPPEPITGGAIDVGDLAAEYLALALNPFPRAPGVVFDGWAAPVPRPESAPNPFAVLASLKKK